MINRLANLTLLRVVGLAAGAAAVSGAAGLVSASAAGYMTGASIDVGGGMGHYL